jgi:hypothetical protein
MSWHVYAIAPIDLRWEFLAAVDATAAEIKAQEQALGSEGDPSSGQFAAAWESAQDAAGEAGWEGDFRHPPRVFWVPGDTEFDFGFVFKQDNNGNTYVISPVELPHLEDPFSA